MLDQSALGATGAGTKRGYVLALLTLVYAFNFVDRQILGILAPSIAADLGFDDTGIGLLTGFWFALFYTILGLPIALYADRVNRVGVVSVALAVWSGFTFMSGFVTSFFWLALMRIGVAVGEAGGSPPSHSLLSDYYEPKERGKALGIYALGIPFGIMTAFFTAALLSTADQTNWRLVFFVLGVPGLILALLLFFTVHEPRRQGPAATPGMAGLKPALTQLLGYRSYWTTALGISFASYSSYALSAFAVRFIAEGFPTIPLTAVLVTLGVLNGTLYAAGTFAGGALSDRFARRSPAGTPLVCAASIAIAAPGLFFAVWTQSWPLFLVFLGINIFFGGFYLGPSFSVAQNLAPPRVRAVSTAIFFFVLNIIALGLGPTITGALSDALGLGKEIWFLPFSGAIVDAVGGGLGADLGRRWALSSLVIPYVIAIGFYLLAAKQYPRDFAAAAKALDEDAALLR